MGLHALRGVLGRYPGQWLLTKMRRWTHWRPLLTVNRDIIIRNLALESVFFGIVILGARLGSLIVAANALLINGMMITSFALDGLSNAIEALTGHALGAGQLLALRRSLVVSTGYAVLASLLATLFFIFFGHAFIELQTHLVAVRMIAFNYLPYLVGLPLMAVWSYLLDGLFIGASRGMKCAIACYWQAVYSRC